MLPVTQFYLRTLKPTWIGWLTRILYFGTRVKIGTNFKCDSIPRIIIDKQCSLQIGDNVEFKRNVEIRTHGSSIITLGNNVRIDRGVRILATNNSRIVLSEGVRIGLYTVLNGGDSIWIGKKSLISGFVYLQTSMHTHLDRSISVQDQGYDHSAICLEDDVWLGTHVVILPGITVAKGAVIGSNAVVTKSVEAFKIMAGIPAKEINERVL